MTGNMETGAPEIIARERSSPRKRLRLLLISNYPPDKQESMLRFASILEGFQARGFHVQRIQPEQRVRSRFRPDSRMAKWAGYVDKFLLFPPRLGRVSKEYDVAHICDHSNAPYYRAIKARASVATCHDLLAVRGALGEPTFCPASRMGKRLQASILSGLSKIPHVACDSDATRADFSRLTGRPPGRALRTILLGFSGVFRSPPAQETQQQLRELGVNGAPYVLHVGSSQERKNREGILKAMALLGTRWTGNIVFAGEVLRPHQRELARSLGLESRVRELGNLSDEALCAVYAGAHALLFPSWCEGFGWPILEGQACGCPVITADNTSLAEVAGAGAIIVPGNDTEGIAEAVLKVGEEGFRRQLIDRATVNLDRFRLADMLDQYERMYVEALEDAA